MATSGLSLPALMCGIALPNPMNVMCASPDRTAGIVPADPLWGMGTMLIPAWCGTQRAYKSGIVASPTSPSSGRRDGFRVRHHFLGRVEGGRRVRHEQVVASSCDGEKL